MRPVSAQFALKMLAVWLSAAGHNHIDVVEQVEARMRAGETDEVVLAEVAQSVHRSLRAAAPSEDSSTGAGHTEGDHGKPAVT